MKKLKNIDRNYLIIIVFCIALVYLVLPTHAIFGSNIDWISQHVVFPNYFRELFYQTKNLFPNFALQIGAGQNIYNFSYYGLLNPLLMISYLLPFLSIKTFIIGLNLFLFVFYGLIQYYFLKSKTSTKSALTTTLLLLLATPILYHLHKHFMFVDYMPFLVLALIGVDKFFETNNRSLVAFSTFIIIMTSYYYSVTAIIVICIYAVYKYLQENNTIEIKDLIKKGLHFTIPIIIAILSACILLLPTLYVLKTGRVPAKSNLPLIYKLLPKFNLSAILYGNYAIGLTFISLLALLYSYTSKKKEQRFLAITLTVLFTIPIFIYLLNGNLYFRNKVLIPFIPLFGLFLIDFIDDLFNRKLNMLNIGIIIFLVIGSSLLLRFNYYAIYADALVLLLIMIIYNKKLTNEYLLTVVILLVPLVTTYISNNPTSYMNENLSNKIDSLIMSNEITNTLSKEKDLVRFNNLENKLESVNQIYNTNYNQNSVYSSVSNQLYRNFYERIFKNALSYRNNLVLSQNNDILFQTFMGVKYIYTTKNAPIGYKKIFDNVYENDNVLPMLYGTSKITNESEFNALQYPKNITKLLNSVVVKDEETTPSKIIPIYKVMPEYDVVSFKNLEITKNDKYTYIKSTKEGGYLNLALKEPINKDILIINLTLLKRQSCDKGDQRIDINDVSNVLTCKEWIYKNSNKTFHYVLSNNKGIKNLKIKLTPGTYKIGNMEVYKLNYDNLESVKNDLSKFIVNRKYSIGDTIEGSIHMKDNGYFVTSIPFDKGFKVIVDNKVVKKSIVNKAFLGFKLNRGQHQIKITYQAPFQKEGKILSLIGIIMFILLLIYDRNSKGKDLKDITDFYNEIKDIGYGWHDNSNKLHTSLAEGNFRKNYRMQKISKNMTYAVCWEMCELERKFFKDKKIDHKVIFTYLDDHKKYPCHTFVTFKLNNKWYLFEGSWQKIKGIHEYNSLDEIINYFRYNFTDFAKGEYDPTKMKFYEYRKPLIRKINCKLFYFHCIHSKKL